MAENSFVPRSVHRRDKGISIGMNELVDGWKSSGSNEVIGNESVDGWKLSGSNMISVGNLICMDIFPFAWDAETCIEVPLRTILNWIG
jgi:hypothetical protein